VLLACATGCSLGQGSGEVKSDALFAHDCWGSIRSGPKGDGYNLEPDFFAAIPYRSTLLIRVQRGNDVQEVSDGLAVLIDDVNKIRETLAKPPLGGGAPVVAGSSCVSATAADGGANDNDCPDGTVGFQVAVPAGVTPPGSPAVPPQDLIDDPPLVHMALYLQRSCHNTNTVLYAVSGKICFSALFSGKPNETQADQKLTDAPFFKVQVGDLRDVPLGTYPRDLPCEFQSTLEGSFRFYFERGQPGQPFP
jgi:hypothetical protein